MMIRVTRVPFGDQFEVTTVEPHNTILELRGSINAVNETSDDYRIIVKGKPVDDMSSTIADLGLVEGDSIHIMYMTNRGGA